MMARAIPHPVLSFVIAGVWVALVNNVSPGAVLLGLALGVAIPLVTRAYWPDAPRLRRPFRIAEYSAIVLWDILVSNLQVAWLVLFRRGASLRSCFVTVPLDLRTPEAIAVLAGTITMTPGTVSADLASDGGAILVHCLDADDPAAVSDAIKRRYERRLKEIFE